MCLIIKKNSVIHHLFLNLSRFSDPKLEISNRQWAHQCYQGNDYDVNYHYLTIASIQTGTKVAFLIETWTQMPPLHVKEAKRVESGTCS